MDRRSLRRCAPPLVVLAAFGSGCARDRDVLETELRMDLPAGDSSAREELARIELEVWPASSGACRELIAWRRQVCGRACAPPPSPRDRGEAPDSLVEMTRDASGWPGARLDLAGDGPWDVRLAGKDAEGAPLVYGCSTISSGAPWTARLWRPWCDSAACAGQFHPACRVEIDCEAAAGSGDPDGLAPPSCRALNPTEWSWEEAGRLCPPPLGAYFAPCVPALVRCEPNALAPMRDGVCPKSGATMCGATPEQDLDCDGRLPGPCGECTSSDPPRECTRAGGGCIGRSECSAAGAWGECVFSTGAIERCDGADEDCDGLRDPDDPDAIDACNAGRAPEAPVADGCSGRGVCSCGAAEACANGLVCCGGRCASLRSEVANCGRCGRPCGRGDTCEGGRCVRPGDGGAPDARDAEDASAPDAPPSDLGARDAGFRDIGSDAGSRDAVVRPDTGAQDQDAGVEDSGARRG